MNNGILRPLSVNIVRAPGIRSGEEWREGQIFAERPIAWLGEHFKRSFPCMVEPPGAAIHVREYELLNEAGDLPHGKIAGIFEKEGEVQSLTITLGEFRTFLLTTDQNKWYVAYVRKDEKEIVGVRAGWMKAGLHVESGPFNRPYPWAPANHFLFP